MQNSRSIFAVPVKPTAQEDLKRPAGDELPSTCRLKRPRQRRARASLKQNLAIGFVLREGNGGVVLLPGIECSLSSRPCCVIDEEFLNLDSHSLLCCSSQVCRMLTPSATCSAWNGRGRKIGVLCVCSVQLQVNILYVSSL